MKHFRHGLTVLALLALSLGMAGCSTVTESGHASAFPSDANWALLPFVNNAQVPQAGQRAEAIAATLLRGHGVTRLAHYPAAANADGLPYLDDAKRLADALAWAKARDYRYGLSGTITEWAYKTGLDGEPAVGVTLKVIDMRTGQVLWSASGARSGWGFSTLSGTAQNLIGDLMSDLPLQP